MTRAEKDAMAEDRGERRDNIGDAGKIWMGTDGESSGWRGHKKIPAAAKRRAAGGRENKINQKGD